MSDGQGLIERPDADPAEPFARMVERIHRNQADDFGGGYVIVSPTGDIKELLVLNNARDPAMFWSAVRTIADLAIAEIEQQARAGGNTFGRR